ncbi:MAG: DNA-3-methyladenine glycosylase I [Chloroflexota bacterium]
MSSETSVVRCFGGEDELYRRYHDEEWARPITDERGLYERLCLEGFQSGLSWLTVLRKREAFRRAFGNFDPEIVAKFVDADVDRLVGDSSIIRHRGKILAAIQNARATVNLRASGSPLPKLIWSFVPQSLPPPRSFADVPAATAESSALSKELKRSGFRFVGPTTVYALMQAAGLVNDHLANCIVREEIVRLHRG